MQRVFIIIFSLGGKPGCGSGEASNTVINSKMFTINDFITTAQIDPFNLFKLINFCHLSKIMHKVLSSFTYIVPLTNFLNSAIVPIAMVGHG